METSQMETIPYMETFLIYQTAYYIKQGGFGNFFSVKSLKWKQFLMKITLFFSFASFSTKINLKFEILSKIEAQKCIKSEKSDSLGKWNYIYPLLVNK